jgi:hypothetical protein
MLGRLAIDRFPGFFCRCNCGGRRSDCEMFASNGILAGVRIAACRNDAHKDHHRRQINLVAASVDAKAICSLCRVHVVFFHRQVYRTP